MIMLKISKLLVYISNKTSKDKTLMWCFTLFVWNAISQGLEKRVLRWNQGSIWKLQELMTSVLLTYITTKINNVRLCSYSFWAKARNYFFSKTEIYYPSKGLNTEKVFFENLWYSSVKEREKIKWVL